MNDDIENMDSHDAIVELVSQAKHRPLPRSTKALTVIVIAAMIFTGGIAYGKHRASASTSAGLSLAGLGGTGFGGGFAGGFGGGRNRTGAGASASAAPSGALAGGSDNFSPGAAASAPSDVAGTVVSITSTSVVIQTLSGSSQSFPLSSATRVRASTSVPLKSVKAGDIVTIKADSANSAKTITVVK
jgi:hypothetical protein